MGNTAGGLPPGMGGPGGPPGQSEEDRKKEQARRQEERKLIVTFANQFYNREETPRGWPNPCWKEEEGKGTRGFDQASPR